MSRTSEEIGRPAPSPAVVERLRRALPTWFAERARDLPWRVDRDPYRVWISEAMLQQTRVETVIDYYERFLARFPDLAALARAPEADVLAAWSGLGYYRRARALQAAAREVLERHGGRFPAERDALLALPGIGPYTAGAIASIAFDRPEPIVDGNVARVFCRWFGLEGELGCGPLMRELWALAERLVPEHGAGTWNQALMELGATVCTPKKPACASCPVRGDCVAHASGRSAELPWPKARPEPIDVELELLLVESRGRWLLEQRPEGERMAGLWQLPTLERPPAGQGPLLFPDHRGRWGRARAGLELGAPLGELRHAITQHRIRAVVRRATLVAGTRIAPPLRWFRRSGLGELALTGMARKALRRWG